MSWRLREPCPARPCLPGDCAYPVAQPATVLTRSPNRWRGEPGRVSRRLRLPGHWAGVCVGTSPTRRLTEPAAKWARSPDPAAA